ncbi:Uncharacterised protein [Mycobacteroides abscessus subsp. massiliense]|nr:Uncharacterised protein [Mycobacteroides abscessus subsp. massiliense]
MIVAQRRGTDETVVYQDLFVERRPDGLCDTAFHLAPALLGIDHHSGVGGLYRLQNAHGAGLRPHRDAEPLDVEGHRARRALVVPHRAQRLRRRGHDLGQTQQICARSHTVRLQHTARFRHRQFRRREANDLVSQQLCRAVHGQAGDGGSGRAECAGVMTHRIGIGLVDIDLIRSAAQHASGKLGMHGGGAVAELGRPHGDPVTAPCVQFSPGFGHMSARGHGCDHGNRHALTHFPARR